MKREREQNCRDHSRKVNLFSEPEYLFKPKTVSKIYMYLAALYASSITIGQLTNKIEITQRLIGVEQISMYLRQSTVEILVKDERISTLANVCLHRNGCGKRLLK